MPGSRDAMDRYYPGVPPASGVKEVGGRRGDAGSRFFLPVPSSGLRVRGVAEVVGVGVSHVSSSRCTSCSWSCSYPAPCVAATRAVTGRRYMESSGLRTPWPPAWLRAGRPAIRGRITTIRVAPPGRARARIAPQCSRAIRAQIARPTARRLVAAGWIERLRRGLYATSGALPGGLALHPFAVATALGHPRRSVTGPPSTTTGSRRRCRGS